MNDGFTKIDLSAAYANQQTERTVDNHNLVKSKRAVIAIILFVILLTGLSLAVILPARSVFAQFQKTTASGKQLVQSLREQNLPQAEENLIETKQHLEKLRKDFNSFAFMKFIPVIRAYYGDFDHGLTAATSLLEALEIAIEAIKPYADLLGLEGESTFVAGSADERIQTAVATFEKVTPKLSQIGSKLEIVQKEVDAINPNRYPNSINNQPIAPKIREIKSLISEVATLFISARPLLEELPSLMGHNQPKTYLVFFKNDKELRPDGGFITAYAVFRLENGKPIVEKADDIYRLDASKSRRIGAPPDILKYHKGVYDFHLRDSNLSPDFVESIKLFEELYQYVPQGVNYDGIITVDTHVLVEAIKILGTFVVYGRTFSVENDPRCDCPRVVYELEDYATRPVAYVREDRKDIIGVLLLQIMQKALGVSPSQYWGKLFQMAIAELNQKHILMFFKNEKAQQAIEKLNWGGRIVDFGGDYLHINDANMAGAKSDLFVQRSVKVEYSKGASSIIKTLTLDYRNPAPPSNCNLEAGELCLNGLLRNWLRIYVPKGSSLIEFRGSEMDPQVKEDLGKTVFEGFLTVKPLGSSQAVVRFSLPSELGKNDTLPVLIQKQPGTEGHSYKITVNGKEVAGFELTSDKQFTINL